MLKPNKMISVALIISIIAVFIGGCGSSAQDSALVGAVIGTGIGAIAGGDLASMAIGGSVGGGIGYWFGSEAEKKAIAAENQQLNSLGALQESEIVWVTNSNGSKTPVKMIRSGNSYIGPRNEHYVSIPSSQQLKPAYGF